MSKADLEKTWSRIARKYSLEVRPPKSAYDFVSKSMNLESLGIELECIGAANGSRGGLGRKVTKALMRFEEKVSCCGPHDERQLLSTSCNTRELQVFSRALALDCLRTTSVYTPFQWKGQRHWKSPGSLISEPCRWHPQVALWTVRRHQNRDTTKALTDLHLSSVRTFYITHGNSGSVAANDWKEAENDDERQETAKGKVPIEESAEPETLFDDIQIVSTDVVKVYDTDSADERDFRELFSKFSAASLRLHPETKSASAPTPRRLLGHLRAIKAAYESTIEYALIVEDSVSPMLAPWWTISLEEFAQGLPQDWEVAQLMHCTSTNVELDKIPKINFRQKKEDPGVLMLSKPYVRGVAVRVL